ncbi:MAG: type II secretion system protein GspE [Chitinivibrionales bacterium]|nr:type II secretion system protein GspE [Chitinivibrionales bacterium]
MIHTTQLLGQILKRSSSIDNSALERAADSARMQGKLIGEYLIENGELSEETVYKALAAQFSLPYIAELQEQVNHELIRDLPTDLFKDGRCLPLSSSDTHLEIVVSNPCDFDIIQAAEAMSGLIVQIHLTTPSKLMQVCNALFEDDSIFKQAAGKISKEYEKHLHNNDSGLSLEEIRKRTESEPVVKLASLIFDEAIRLNASDIHVEPSEYNAVVRFRIDGLLRQHTEVTAWMYTPLTSRIKILADLDIAERRVPQDGRIRYAYRGNEFDFRVSTLPTHHGEKTVIRILKHDQRLLEMKNLGLPEHQMPQILELLEKPQGMVFVTGPTGSGKSSTLFACLNHIRTKAINITTIENPIEYKLSGVNQVQINEKAGVTFARTLRSILRQDPDVILIGEIRDKETAGIATQASQTGHLVFSTLHTNDAVSAITRLRDLGIPGFLISSSLLAIMAQRLVRVICPECRTKKEPSEDIRNRWNMLLGNVPMPESYQAVGCKACHDIGYKGRTGLFEVVTVNETVRNLIAEDASEVAIRKALREMGTKSLIFDGIDKIRRGITTPEELLRVVLVEDTAELRTGAEEPQPAAGE